jgi:hypothetical protein
MTNHAITHTLPEITERWLEDVLGEIGRTGRPPRGKLPRSASFLVRSLIRERLGIVLPVWEVERLLIEERLLKS